MHLSRERLLLGLSAKHSPVDEECTQSQHNEEDDTEHDDDAGVSACPIVSFQELMRVRMIVYFADDSHRDGFGERPAFSSRFLISWDIGESNS
jgi:hypothetical protein